MTGPGLATVNNGNPTFPAGSVVDSGNGPVTTPTPTPVNQNGGSTNPTPAQSGYGNPTGGGNYGPTVAAPYGYSTINGVVTPNSAPGASTTEPTAGSVYGTSGNPDLDSAEAQAEAYAKEAADAADPTDPATQAQIRAQTLASFQAQIDATNQMYANELAAAKVAGQGRIGSATATEARGGLLGSDFGQSQTSTVVSGNQSIYDGITAQQNAAIQAILTQSNNAATQAIKDATTAKQNGLDSYVKYLQDASTRNQTNATAAAQAALQAGVDPTTLTPDQLNTYLTNYGISQSDFTKAYTAAKPAYDAAKAAAAKAAQTTLASGAEVIGADGKVVATNPKPDVAPTLPQSVQEFNYAVQNSGYKGSYTDFLKLQANLKTPADTAAATAAAKQAAEQQTIDGLNTSIQNLIKTTGGPNGTGRKDAYLSPTEYSAYERSWVAAGYSPADFEASFGNYKSPNKPTG